MSNYPSEIYEIENSSEIESMWDSFNNEPHVARCDTCRKELTCEDIDKCEDYCIKCWNESEERFSKLLTDYTPDYI